MVDQRSDGSAAMKVAVITGGSHGIGAGLVTAYRREGWAVVANSRTIEPSDDADILTIDGDVSDSGTTDRIVTGALDRFGRIDTLVNNAGVFISKPFTDYTWDDYAHVVSVNLTGFFILTQRAIGEMVGHGGGHIVNITTTLVDYANSKVPSGAHRNAHRRPRARACAAPRAFGCWLAPIVSRRCRASPSHCDDQAVLSSGCSRLQVCSI